MSQDIRAGKWDLHATAGTAPTLTTTWTQDDVAYSLVGKTVTLYVGGTVTDPTSFTGATSYAGTISTNTATFTPTIPTTTTSTPLRMTVNGVLVAIGTLTPSTVGSASPELDVTVAVDSRSFAVTVNRSDVVEWRANVKDYGAAGDGATDDTAAFALAVASGLSEVYVPDGTFLVDVVTLNQDDQTLRLDAGAVLKLNASKNANVVYISGDRVTVTGGGTIDGNRTAQNTTEGLTINGIEARSCSRPVVRGVVIQNCAHQGVLFQNVTDARLQDCTITNCNATNKNQKAVSVYSTYGASTGVSIVNNVIDGTTPGSGGVAVVAPSAITHSRIRISGNEILVGAAGAGIYTLGIECYCSTGGAIEDVVISDNLVVGETSANRTIMGISLGGLATLSTNGNRNVSITGNTIRGCNWQGIEILGNNVVATGNQMYACGYSSVNSSNVTGGSRGIVFSNNTTVGCVDTNYAIAVQGDTTGVVGVQLSGNSIYDCDGAGIVLLGLVTRPRVAGNTIEAPAKHGIWVFAGSTVTDFSISGNAISLSGAAADMDCISINSSSSARGIIDGNKLSDATRDGIRAVSAVVDLAVRNNMISSCVDGIRTVAGCSDWLITDNYVLNCTGIGITAAGSPTAVEVSGNSFRNNTTNWNAGAATFRASQAPSGLQTRVQSSTVEDADFAVTPVDGTIVGDSTGGAPKIWIRLGGSWYKVAVA